MTVRILVGRILLWFLDAARDERRRRAMLRDMPRFNWLALEVKRTAEPSE